MVRRTKLFEATDMIPLRETTYKCGRMERLVLHYLSRQIRIFGRDKIRVKEVFQQMRGDDKERKLSEMVDVIRRLERRNLVKLL